MNKISLSTYSIRIKDKAKDVYVNLDEFLPKKDFLNFVKEYFEFVESKLEKDEENQKIIRINNGKVRSIKRHIKGIIETGDYGFESEIIDSNKGEVLYKRKATDAEMLPFYFLISLPKQKDKGFIILQRFGQYGISKIIRDSMNQFLKSRTQGLTLEFNPLVSENVVNEFLNKGSVTKLIFRKFGIPKDLADYFDHRSTKNTNGYVEFKIVASKNSTLPVRGTIKKFITGSGAMNKLLEIHDMSFNSARVVVTHNGVKRTVNLDNFSSFRPYYDVTEDVRTGADGHPTFNSIDKAAVNLLEEIFELVYPGQDVE